jgi:hypothetical protein
MPSRDFDVKPNSKVSVPVSDFVKGVLGELNESQTHGHWSFKIQAGLILAFPEAWRGRLMGYGSKIASMI